MVYSSRRGVDSAVAHLMDEPPFWTFVAVATMATHKRTGPFPSHDSSRRGDNGRVPDVTAPQHLVTALDPGQASAIENLLIDYHAGLEAGGLLDGPTRDAHDAAHELATILRAR